MAETQIRQAAPTSGQLAAARGFVAAHGRAGKGCRAVVERIGRAGARVVLVGADGVLGDVTVADAETGEALVGAVSGIEPAEWDAATVGATVIGPAHRRKMAGPRARR